MLCEAFNLLLWIKGAAGVEGGEDFGLNFVKFSRSPL